MRVLNREDSARPRGTGSVWSLRPACRLSPAVATPSGSSVNRINPFWSGPTPPPRGDSRPERRTGPVDEDAASILIMRLDVTHPVIAPLRRFVREVPRFVREQDITGWIGHDRLGILLPQALPAGAFRVARDVGHFASEALSCPVHMMIYRVESAGVPDIRTSMQQHPPLSVPSGTRAPEVSAGSGDPLLTLNESWSRVWSTVAEPRTTGRIPWWKRAMDITVSATLLICLSPLLLTLAGFITLTSPGPVFFKQERIGYQGRRFTCWKFRSMKVGADSGTHRQYLEGLIHSDKPMEKLDSGRDPRMITLGRLFRASGLDELPQLFNVLRGDMSLVGPRPCIPYEYEQYFPWHRKRFDTLPGLTGLWQVSGKNKTTFNEMMFLDIAYVQHLSLWQDLAILARTPLVLAKQILNTAFAGERKS